MHHRRYAAFASNFRKRRSEHDLLRALESPLPQLNPCGQMTWAVGDDLHFNARSKRMKGSLSLSSSNRIPSSHESICQGALPAHKLRRVIERMNADLDTDLDLETIAAESGYSRNHFLRMFRTATECTPHQYFLRLRIEKAQSLMKNQSLRIIDIAESCGFTSQSQFSRVFRRVIGVTPRQYRRDTL